MCLIQGAYTKKPAVYIQGVARHFALAFAAALRRKRLGEVAEAETSGEESVFVNDLLRSSGWRLVRVWFWRRKAHINVYEASVVCSLMKQLLIESPSVRVGVIVDFPCKRCSGEGKKFRTHPIAGVEAGCSFSDCRLHLSCIQLWALEVECFR